MAGRQKIHVSWVDIYWPLVFKLQVGEKQNMHNTLLAGMAANIAIVCLDKILLYFAEPSLQPSVFVFL